MPQGKGTYGNQVGRPAKKLTLKDLLMRDQVSRDVIQRGKILDDYTRKIMEERSKRPDIGGKKIKINRSKKEKNLLRDALRVGSSPSASGVKFPRIGTNKTKSSMSKKKKKM